MNHAVQLIEKSSAFEDVVECVRGGHGLPCSVFGVTQNAKAYFVAAVEDAAKKQVVCITSTEQSAQDLAGAVDGLFFPDNEIELRDVTARGRQSELARIGVLKKAGKTKEPVFLSARAFITRMMPQTAFVRACINLMQGGKYDVFKLLAQFVQNGYERVGTVYSKGEFAMRGEILDIYPADSKKPLRVTFFDDEIESIRAFECETQKSYKKQIERYTLPPAREVVLDEQAREKMLAYLKDTDTKTNDIAFEIQEYGGFDTANTFLPVMFEPASVADYFKDALFLFDDFEHIHDETKRIRAEFEDMHQRLLKENETFLVQGECYFDLKSVIKKLEHKIIDVASGQSSLKTIGEADMQMRSAQGVMGRIDQLANLIKERLKHGYAMMLFAGEKAQALSKSLLEFDVIAPVVTELEGKICISEQPLAYGFEIPSAKCMLLGLNDIFGRIKKSIDKKHRTKPEEDIFSDLSPGDYVVHDVHGKGKYIGLKTLETGGSVGEYMEVEYRGGDKLYISTAQIDRVQKYIGGEDNAPQLSKLGGKEWENAKAKVRESALKLAFDLVDLYAQRFDNSGYVFGKDTVWQQQFEDAFEYEETQGQLDSIEQVKKDMESAKVMDRLLLGDVGYGKTEVAMRAAMKAVMDSKQVAVLVPTTLLARQHLKTFQKRFADFPVSIAGISRFSKSHHKQILEDVRRGKVDIIIGTHRLLSNDVKFNDLGLLIVDEEQRFGVTHKEKIKLFKKSVDVLTLSATPIPRTLEMSMVGIRDLSTIDTPPAMRKQPYSYVMRYSDGLLRDAVTRELARGGQAYFVCRQIRGMNKLLEDLKRNVPQARVAAAHGQMSEAELERVVGGFIDGEFDVLVCTTIIESGIDIASVNTIIVYEADKFGLSQLYQLKGRVGRSDKTSYAYFTFLGEEVLKENAKKRLEAIREFTQLGSGFKIAMRDLQIRGAGNLLGAEQSGHMATVGYSMYCKIMREAVAMAKGKSLPAEFETTVELNVSAYIPDKYIKNQTDKMDIYKLIAKIKSIADGKAAAKELTDRYGKIPIEVNNLILCAIIKSYAASAGIASVIKKNGTIELKYSEQVSVNVKKLLSITGKYPKDVILRPSTPTVLVYKMTKDLPTTVFLEFLSELAHCKSGAVVV
ncbi:MAG: transcription-repair coupling factor [Christensenellaceae bacterium]